MSVARKMHHNGRNAAGMQSAAHGHMQITGIIL